MGDSDPAPVPSAGRSGAGTLVKGCGALVVVAAALFALMTWRASARLDARVDALKQVIAAERATLVGTRPARFGPAREGNAYDDYVAVEWVLGPSDRLVEPPASMSPVELPRDAAAGLKPELHKALHSALEAVERGAPVPDEARAHVARFASVLRHVRDGLAKTRCEWPFAYEDGLAVDLPQLLPARNAAQLMALEAEDLEPDAAARVGLHIVAYGDDLARHPALIGAMIGIAVKQIGVSSLERTLRRGPLSRGACEEVIATLADLSATDLARSFRAERLCTQADLARFAGRPLAPPPPGRDPSSDGGLPRLGPAFLEHEWEGYLKLMDLAEAAATAPFAERAARQAELDHVVATSWYLIGKIAAPDLTRASDQALASRAQVELVRLLAAAHLHRLETGALPADAAVLAPRFPGGAVPADPFDGAPLRYALAGGEVTVWSVGRDRKDDGGAGHGEKLADAKDVVLKGR